MHEIAYTHDALAQLTTLYPERDRLASMSQTPQLVDTQSLSSVQSLLVQTLDLLARLKDRRIQWLKARPFSEHAIPPGPHFESYSTQDYPFEETLRFSSAKAANSFIFQHTAIVLFHQFAVSVCELLPSSQQTEFKDGYLTAKHLSSAVAQILKSVDFHFQSTNLDCKPNKNSDPSYLLFPLRIAFKALEDSPLPEDQPRRLWLADAFAIAISRIQPWTTNKGFLALKHLQQ